MVSNKELENVSKLFPEDRYKYSIKKIADFEELFVLKDGDGNLAISIIDNFKAVSIWPTVEYVKSCQNGVWDQFQSYSYSLEELENDLLPLIRKERYVIDVLPVNNISGFVVSIDEFVRDLNEELENYQ